MNKNNNLVYGRGVGIVMLGGSWRPNGVGAVDNTLNIGDWFTVARTGVGLYTVTLRDLFVGIYGCSFSVQSVTGGTVYQCAPTAATGVSPDTLVSTTGAVPLVVSTAAGVAADPVSNAANRVHMTFMMKNSTGQ